GGRREGDHHSGDDERLRDRIAAKSRRRTAASDDAEDQERAGAEDIERENLAQRMRLHDHAVEAETRGHCAAQPEHGCAHGAASRSGGRASNRASVAATVSIMTSSMTRMIGLA